MVLVYSRCLVWAYPSHRSVGAIEPVLPRIVAVSLPSGELARQLKSPFSIGDTSSKGPLSVAKKAY